MEYVIDEYETLYDRTVSEEECEILKNRFMGMYVTRDLYEIYNWLLEEAGIQPFRKGLTRNEPFRMKMYIRCCI